MMSLLTTVEVLYHISTMVAAVSSSDALQVAAAAVDSNAAKGERVSEPQPTPETPNPALNPSAEASTSRTADSSTGDESSADTFMKAILLALLILIGVSTVGVLRRVWLRMRGRPAQSESRITQYLSQLSALQRLGFGVGDRDRGEDGDGDGDGDGDDGSDQQIGEANLRMMLAMLGRDFSPEDYHVLQQLDGDRNPHGYGGKYSLRRGNARVCMSHMYVLACGVTCHPTLTLPPPQTNPVKATTGSRRAPSGDTPCAR